MKVGFVGQGYIGKNYADEFATRDYEVVRYSLEPEYVDNKADIADCDVVFIAVPTPTTPEGADYSIVEDAVGLVGAGKTAVIKSTILPGVTRKIQATHQDVTVLFSPEFLSKVSAAHDAQHPMCNVVGLLESDERYTTAGQQVMDMLPASEHNFIVHAEAAELFKYAHNVHGYMRVIFANILYDAADTLDAPWADMEAMMNSNPMMSPYYNAPVHQGGRGAGGCCFIKDMAAFRSFYESVVVDDQIGIDLLKAFERKNLELLAASDKNADIVEEVYGDETV